MSLTYQELLDGVTGSAVGVRCRTALQPLGGAGDKVFPPTYRVPDRAETKYATEERKAGDGVVKAVVLDSVASQANRLELGLLEAIRNGDLAAPVTSVDFANVGLIGLDRVSDYEAPHRIFDAILRDSYDEDKLFRFGPVGRAITEARPRDAGAVYVHSPHTLVFGGWDSTGPRGGLGAKYERCITSEITALDIQTGVRTSSRIDPLGIEKDSGRLYEAPGNDSFTLNEDEAVKDKKGKPKMLGRDADVGRPAQANHGNIPPSIDAQNGGITAGQIVGTTVLSFIQLRRLKFPAGADGTALDGRAQAEPAARAALAALGLTAAVLAFEQGFDLRSRCVLVADGPVSLELVSRDGSAANFDMSPAEALELVAECSERATRAGLRWRTEEMLLRPAERLVTLVRKSQEIAEISEDGAQ